MKNNIDLDDEVKISYGKFGGALSPIKGLRGSIKYESTVKKRFPCRVLVKKGNA